MVITVLKLDIDFLDDLVNFLVFGSFWKVNKPPPSPTVLSFMSHRFSQPFGRLSNSRDNVKH